MGLLSSGQSMLSRVMKAEGQDITYRRGIRSIQITATPDGPQDMAASGDGLVVEFGERDFAMDLADLGVMGLPADGDLITWGVYTYKVLPGSQGTRCYDWMDNRHLRVTVHTKLIGAS